MYDGYYINGMLVLYVILNQINYFIFLRFSFLFDDSGLVIVMLCQEYKWIYFV